MNLNDTVLLVEDDENDILFMQHAFAEAGISIPLQLAKDGRQALDYLGGVDHYADRERFPIPSLILLDLKLPRVMGFDVLKWIRAQPEFDGLVVIILSSSQLEPDIEMAYKLGANAYLVKPINLSKRVEIATGLKLFWLRLNCHPKKFSGTAQRVLNLN